MRRKLIFGVNKVDTTDLSSYQGVANGATVSVLRPGFVVNASGGPLSDGATAAVEDTENIGGIVVGDYLYHESGGIVDTDTKLLVTSIDFFPASQWAVAIENQSGKAVSWSAGDKFVLINDSALYPTHFVTVYSDDTSSLTISNPNTLGQTGMFQGYVDATLDVDIAISGSGLTTQYYTDLAADERTEINVKEFGATGDGTTDDRDAIRKALDFALTVGASLYIPKGTYLVGSSIASGSVSGWISADIRIYGDGPDLTVLQSDFSNAQILQLLSLGSLTVEGITFRGTGDDSNQDATGLEAIGTERLVVRDCRFYEFGADGIYIGADTTNANNTGSALVEGCEFDDCSRGGITITAGNNIRLIGNHVGDGYGSGTVTAYQEGVNIEENNDAYTIRNLVIDGNVFERGMAIGGYPQSAGDALTYAVVTNNIIRGPSGSETDASPSATDRYGVEQPLAIEHVHEIVFTGNVCEQRYSGAATDSIAFRFRTLRATVHDNVFSAEGGKCQRVVTFETPARTNPSGEHYVSFKGNTLIGGTIGATGNSDLLYHSPGTADAGSWEFCGNTFRLATGLQWERGIRIQCLGDAVQKYAINGNMFHTTDDVDHSIYITDDGTATAGKKSLIVSDNVVDGNVSQIFMSTLTNWDVRLLQNQFNGSGIEIVNSGNVLGYGTQETVASATALALADSTTTAIVTGTTTVATMTDHWDGRRVTLVASDASGFTITDTAGGNDEFRATADTDIVLTQGTGVTFEAVTIGGTRIWAQVG